MDLYNYIYIILLSHFDYGQYQQQLFDMGLPQLSALHPHAEIQTFWYLLHLVADLNFVCILLYAHKPLAQDKLMANITVS